MSNLVRWEPFRELTDFRDAMDRVFERPFTRPWRVLKWEPVEAQLPVDLYGTDDAVSVTASLPGVKAEDISISVTGRTLTIKGETKDENEEKDQNYYRQERRFGAFQRVITLPVKVEADKASATFEDGVLTLELPKAPEVKAQTIEVKPKKTAAGSAS